MMLFSSCQNTPKGKGDFGHILGIVLIIIIKGYFFIEYDSSTKNETSVVICSPTRCSKPDFCRTPTNIFRKVLFVYTMKINVFWTPMIFKIFFYALQKNKKKILHIRLSK